MKNDIIRSKHTATIYDEYGVVPPKSCKQAIIYCRFSPRPNADECKSNEKQEERCRKYCRGEGYAMFREVVGIFSDDAVSGKTLDRPGLTATIAALQPDMVLVIDTNDRLARDMLVALTIHHQVEQKGATIETADYSPARTTPEGNLMANILAAFAQFERERFARRTKAGLAKKKANGQWLGKPPIGYNLDSVTKQLVENADEQKAVDLIFSFHKLGMSSDKIALIMTPECGYLCRGKPWSARTIRKLVAKSKKTS